MSTSLQRGFSVDSTTGMPRSMPCRRRSSFRTCGIELSQDWVQRALYPHRPGCMRHQSPPSCAAAAGLPDFAMCVAWQWPQQRQTRLDCAIHPGCTRMHCWPSWLLLSIQAGQGLRAQWWHHRADKLAHCSGEGVHIALRHVRDAQAAGVGLCAGARDAEDRDAPPVAGRQQGHLTMARDAE